jgi:hypothetical protein
MGPAPEPAFRNRYSTAHTCQAPTPRHQRIVSAFWTENPGRRPVCQPLLLLRSRRSQQRSQVDIVETSRTIYAIGLNDPSDIQCQHYYCDCSYACVAVRNDAMYRTSPSTLCPRSWAQCPDCAARQRSLVARFAACIVHVPTTSAHQCIRSTLHERCTDMDSSSVPAARRSFALRCRVAEHGLAHQVETSTPYRSLSAELPWNNIDNTGVPRRKHLGCL